MDTAEVLERAAEVIEEVGWCRGSLRAPDGRVCLAGAIEEAIILLGDEPNRPPRLLSWEEQGISRVAMDVVDRLVEPESKIPVGAAIRWNDEEASDQYEVIDVLKTAAKHVRNGEV